METGLAVFAPEIDVSVALQQDVHDGAMSALASVNEIAVSGAILQVDVGAGTQELVGDVVVALLAGDSQGSHAVLVHRVDVGTLLDQHIHDLHGVASRCDQQWGPRVHAHGVHGCARPQQQLNDIPVASPTSPDERRRPILVGQVHLFWVKIR